MGDGYTYSPQILNDVMPASDLDEDLTKNMYEQSLATLGRLFWLYLPSPVTSTSATYGSAEFDWVEMETPDEPRGLNLSFIMYVSGGGTSAVATIQIDDDGSTNVEVTTTSTDVLNVETFFLDQAVWSSRKDTQVKVSLFLRVNGGGTCNVEDPGYPRCDWVQAAA